MTRVVALYRMPEDPEGFERRYRESHLPLVTRTPGLTAVEVSRVERTLLGEPAFLLTTMDFGSPDSLSAALASAEWTAAGRNLAEIGGIELATLFTLPDVESVPLSTGGAG